ncbi:MAG TPA: amidase family protein [Chloroflexota bacterium]|nr:amidase family protein [Chloroflexota bacterium]
MSADELCWTPARELARMIRATEVSPVEVVDAVLERMGWVNPRINAYCTLTADLALESARAAEVAAARGDSLGPLHGVPFSLKDLTPTRGIRTTMGSKIFEHNVPAEDAVLVERLREAGGILLGKTNTPEFGCKPFTDNLIFGTTRNPWSLDRSPGGSSGGAAAAVAAGLGPLAEGSDLAASIRQPAAWCGVVGFKPCQGRIARYPSQTGWNAMSMNGPITRTVGDAALMFSAMVGPDPRDPLALPHTGENWARLADGPSIRGMRAAWTPDLGGAAAVDPAIAKTCEAAAKTFGDLGCELEEASPEVGNITDPFLVLNAGLRQATLGKYLAEWRDQMDPILVKRLEVSLECSAADVGRADVERTAHHQRLSRFFERFDLLVLPTTATAARPLDALLPAEIAGRPITQHLDMLIPTFAFNLSAYPAISVPCGWTDDGLPVGLQIVAGWHQDARVLQAAACFEAARPWAARRPVLE